LAARWTVVDDYVRSAGEPSNIVSITADSNGNVYAVGLARQGTFAGIVRRAATVVGTGHKPTGVPVYRTTPRRTTRATCT